MRHAKACSHRLLAQSPRAVNQPGSLALNRQDEQQTNTSQAANSRRLGAGCNERLTRLRTCVGDGAGCNEHLSGCEPALVMGLVVTNASQGCEPALVMGLVVTNTSQAANSRRLALISPTVASCSSCKSQVAAAAPSSLQRQHGPRIAIQESLPVLNSHAAFGIKPTPGSAISFAEPGESV